ncbi:MAG: DEAD/DEAH box helicase family protein [Lentisphaeria bacterium]|nr:DEAD/DEAH box helicase family protein [Lentisphaeria bacterium]
MIELDFQSGTLNISGVKSLPPDIAKYTLPDERSGTFRAKACYYAPLVLALRQAQIAFTDRARNYPLLPQLALTGKLIPRPHQSKALNAWKQADCRGVVCLPTGAGKTILAIMAMDYLKRPALILVPTIDLLTQWCSTIERFFGIKCGMLGGGTRDIREITVSTYDSALLNMEFIGNRFALLIADECHHLPSPENRLCAAMAIAPFRLGLTATPELPEDYTAVLNDMMGDICCNIGIRELAGKVLSAYQVKQLRVELSGREAAAYQHHRHIYTSFLRRAAIDFHRKNAWSDFLIACARMPGGKEALHAFFAQRHIARAGSAKLDMIEAVMRRHAGEQIIIFTADNDAAYTIGRKFMLPVLTHHTKAAERKQFLELFRQGRYPVLVTSKVLNEGVDVPQASVGIIVSGSGSVREHVQRLGRILRHAPGKEQAMLYELVSANTSEESISARRREHDAYQER